MGLRSGGKTCGRKTRKKTTVSSQIMGKLIGIPML